MKIGRLFAQGLCVINLITFQPRIQVIMIICRADVVSCLGLEPERALPAGLQFIEAGVNELFSAAANDQIGLSGGSADFAERQFAEDFSESAGVGGGNFDEEP